MNIENMKIISIDDNKTNLLIIESYAKFLSLIYLVFKSFRCC